MGPVRPCSLASSVPAAPARSTSFAGWLSKVLPQRLLMAVVAGVVGAIGLNNLVRFASAE
jgi:hypothetical protein